MGKKLLTVIKNCPICNQKLSKILDKDGFLVDRWCNRCGTHWSIFDLEIKEKKRALNLDKWI